MIHKSNMNLRGGSGLLYTLDLPITAEMLRLRRLAVDRLLISHSVLSLPSRLLVALLLTRRPLVRLFKSVQFLLRCGFLDRYRVVTIICVNANTT